ncbi:Chloramphenicol 3-O phosphotransferase [Falsiruegeria litorea R37]|uniref:Chloramphenicol 3-O phosphotransferase n=1 Tax=Falsiruegeria litorea R37 TaxID=1200284 RepID=A0A1Y5SMS7_9RHOB|nr:AAA family ATPase [Falsiruegeria litorea]SLN43931.1 Chloramphenicol 3-O phosphotransferase [Falsiruegeria litorea R37]
MAQVILLNSPSSSGKSTLARALQAQADAPFWHISLDHLRDSGILPMDRFRTGDLDRKAHRARAFDGLHAMASAAADAGNNLIFEHLLEDSAWIEALKHSLASHDVLFVGVYCDLDVLNTRERERGDRPIGSAALDHASVHVGRTYDITVDGTAPIQTNVDAILKALGSGRRVSEFHTAR